MSQPTVAALTGSAADLDQWELALTQLQAIFAHAAAAKLKSPRRMAKIDAVHGRMAVVARCHPLTKAEV